MDTKKLVLAVILSIVVIVIYQYFFMPKPTKPVPRPATEVTSGEVQPERQPLLEEKKDQKPSDQDLSGSSIEDIFAKKEKKAEVIEKKSGPITQDLKDTIQKDIVVETNLFTAVFTNTGAGLKSFVLNDRFYGDKKYFDDKNQPLDLISEKVKKFGLYPFHFSPLEGKNVFKELNAQNFAYNGNLNLRIGENGKKEIVFKYADQKNSIYALKKFTISDNSYVIGFEYEVIKDGKYLDVPVIFGPDLENNISQTRALQQPLKIGAFDGQDISSAVFSKIKTSKTNNPALEIASSVMDGSFFWAAYETTYFAAIFKTDPRNSSLKYYLVKDMSEKDKVNLYSYLIVTNPGPVYLGPKDERVLSLVSGIFVDVNNVVEYGWFGSIAKIMLKGINFIHEKVLSFGNYGWAIIIFTLFLKILLFPLTYTSSVSMAKMQTLQPKIKAIKKKYKNQRDPAQRKAMNTEMMALYKQEKVNPAGGCLPMLLQLPILWGFFRLLAVSINVRHEPWILWITDLSVKDPYYILPILMGITQIILQKMSPTGGAEGAQKKMMYIMPVVIVFFVMNLPSGLTLYWFVSNILQLGQQHIINKRIYSKKKEEDRQRKINKRKKRGKV